MKKLYLIFLVLVLALTTMIPVGVVSADSSVQVSGSYVIQTENFAMPKVVGKDRVYMGWTYQKVEYGDDIEGTASENLSFRWNSNANSGALASRGIHIFEGKVLGKEGTFTANIRHQTVKGGSWKGELTIVSGTGELANLHGTLILEFTQTPGVYEYVGTYSGRLTFAP